VGGKGSGRWPSRKAHGMRGRHRRIVYPSEISAIHTFNGKTCVVRKEGERFIIVRD